MARTDIDSQSESSVEAWARARLEKDGLSSELRAPLEQLIAVVAAQRGEQHSSFLSVVIRTQAQRWEQIQDAFLCLNAQTDQGFETIVMMHDVDADNSARFADLVSSYPDSFSSRVRVVQVVGGGRTKPLAESLLHLRSEYVAYFDDDDLLMADWVESFRRAAEANQGKVLRANVAVQLNRRERWSDGSEGQRSISVAHAPYTSSFQLIEHLERSYSPFMGVAYPVAFFSEWGETFDESLPVCEDWDILMRATTLMGVASLQELTAIYRLWENVETSYTGHSEAIWDDAKDKLQQKLNMTPFLMPVGSLPSMIELARLETPEQRALQLALEQSEAVREALESSTIWRVSAPIRKLLERVRRRRTSS